MARVVLLGAENLVRAVAGTKFMHPAGALRLVCRRPACCVAPGCNATAPPAAMAGKIAGKDRQAAMADGANAGTGGIEAAGTTSHDSAKIVKRPTTARMNRHAPGNR